MARYAAKLLFDWMPDPYTGNRVTRHFEERIITFNARSPRAAVSRAKRLGRRSELHFNSGHRLRFVGLLQLMELGIECGEGEVWWEFRRRRLTLTQARASLPAEKALYVFTDDGGPSTRRKRGRSRR